VFIPLVDLRQETRCEINVAKGSDRLLPGEVEVYRYFKALYAFGGWLIISLAIVTFTGVLQNRDVQ
jgi:quinol-cytochrome oxidoreductase complex cytochrome b subunit